jgi:hypothetical protein
MLTVAHNRPEAATYRSTTAVICGQHRPTTKITTSVCASS